MSESPHPVPRPAPEGVQQSKKPSRIPAFIPIAVIGAVLLGIVIIALVVVLALRTFVFPSHLDGIPLEVTRVSPLGPSPLPFPPLVEVGDTQVILQIPVALEAGNRSFPVLPSDPDGGAWADPSLYPDHAIWVYGTVVNYVMGLEATPDNRALLAGLGADAPLLLQLSGGARLIFRVTRQETVAPDDTAIFAQSQPGLTLLLLGEGEEERMAVLAGFDRAEEPTPQADSPAAGLGQPVNVGDVRVTAIEGHGEPGGADQPPGTMAYLVEFSARNVGQSSLDTRGFSTELVDGVGNRYLPSPSIAAQGWYGPLQGKLAPGEEVNGTAGYLVPEGLEGPTLTWLFGPQVGSELRARFSIPYTPPSVTAPAWSDVTILEAFLGEGGATLHVVAQVHNLAASTLTVTDGDVSLSSSAGVGELQVAAPPFPWAIAAGEAREVELQFARPQASTAVVTILGYTFEISGMP